MSCFCKIPATRSQASMGRMRFKVTPPKIPLQMKLAAAGGIAMEAERADMKINLAVRDVRMPNVTLGGSTLMALAMQLQVVGGVFKLDDLPMLDMQMKQAATSFQKNVWPRLQPYARIDPMPVIRLAMVARLALKLEQMKIDPLAPESMAPPPPLPPDVYMLKLSAPKLKLAKIAIGLPPLLKMTEMMKIPLGDPAAGAMMKNRLAGLAELKPPKLTVQMPILLKIALVLDALATIKQAFGDDAMTPQGQFRIAAMLRGWMRLALPIPKPALTLADKLELLPKPDDVKAGAALMGHSPLTGMARMTPPKLAIAPFLNVMVALRQALELQAEFPAMDACDACNTLASAL